MKKILSTIIMAFIIIAFMWIILFLSSGCKSIEVYKTVDKGETEKKDNEEFLLELAEKSKDLPGSGFKEYYPVVDGLHVTGKPVTVDIGKYRLEITGDVNKELSLTFDEIKNMESTRIFSELNCPGYFSDEGFWTGVEIRKLLQMAEVNDNALSVAFYSIDGEYKIVLSMEKIMNNEGILAAYHINDKEFPEIHGYPLRLVAREEPGYVWVKWLGKIEVVSEEIIEENPMAE